MSAIVQQTKEWLEMRKNKIGASDAPVIMEVSPFKTKYQLWEEKIGLRKSVKTSRMERGLELEAKARKRFEELTGIVVIPQVLMHPKIKWMMASLDGLSLDSKHLVEIKCAGNEDHEQAKAGKIPDKYYPQIQHQLEVSELDSAFYFSFDGEDGVVVECQRDTKYINSMIEKEAEFFKCVQDFVAPSLNEKDYEIKDDPLWEAAAIEWLAISDQLAKIETREKELKDMLISMAEGKNAVGYGIKLSKVARKGNIDYIKVPELKGVKLEKYRKDPVEFWRVTIAS